MPTTASKNELDVNYENMIENLLLQQVLLYTRERSRHSDRIRGPTTMSNSLLVRQSVTSQSEQHYSTRALALHTSAAAVDDDEEPTLCLIESQQNNSSDLIENILQQYNQRNDQNSRFDRDLMELIMQRNRRRRSVSRCTNGVFYSRLQWLAIGQVIDRLFFYVYFTATIISYFVTLWLIPFSHPNLTIDIEKL